MEPDDRDFWAEWNAWYANLQKQSQEYRTALSYLYEGLPTAAAKAEPVVGPAGERRRAVSRGPDV